MQVNSMRALETGARESEEFHHGRQEGTRTGMAGQPCSLRQLNTADWIELEAL